MRRKDPPGRPLEALTGQPLEILRLLRGRPGEIVGRDEIRRRLWPDGTFVDFEHSLNAAIKRLRASLGDDPIRPRFIETIPRRGYRWIDASSSGPRPLSVGPFFDDGSDGSFARGLVEELCAQLGRRAAGRLQIRRKASAENADRGAARADDGVASARPLAIEGSVRRHANRLRVSVTLLEAAEGVQIWSEIFDVDAKHPIDAQIEIASQAAAAIVDQLSPSSVAAHSVRMLTMIRRAAHDAVSCA